MSKAKCTSSKALGAHDRWAWKCMKKYGFYSHFVLGGDFDNSPSGVNIHTHGIPESLGHPDFQITVLLDPEIASGIFHNLYKRLKAGRTFEAGDVASNILGGGMKITFIEVMECDRPVLRVILPDPDGNIRRSTMNREWRTAQFG